MSKETQIFRYRADIHLEEYVKTKGRYCPPDIQDFDQAIGNLSHQCPLCGVQHHDYESMTFSLDGALYDTFICPHCEPEVHMVRISASPLMGINATLRINNFLETGEFPEDALDYVNTPNMCVWCDKHIDVNNVTKMALPVGICDANYHNVSSCRTCSKYVLDDYPNIYIDIDKCYECGIDYPITKEEFNSRLEDSTLCDHLCGDCGLNYGLTPTVSRFDFKNCSICKEQFVLDKSIASHRSIHIYSNDTFICSSCIEEERVNFNVGVDKIKLRKATERLQKMYGVKHSVHITGDVYTLIIEQTAGTFTFEVVKMSELQENYVSLYRSRRRWSLIQDACTEGVTYSYNYIRNKLLNKSKWL